jgi:hypothetical protein
MLTLPLIQTLEIDRDKSIADAEEQKVCFIIALFAFTHASLAAGGSLPTQGRGQGYCPLSGAR